MPIKLCGRCTKEETCEITAKLKKIDNADEAMNTSSDEPWSVYPGVTVVAFWVCPKDGVGEIECVHFEDALKAQEDGRPA